MTILGKLTLGEHRELWNLPGADQSVSLFVACGLFGALSSSSEGCELDVLHVDEEKYPSWSMGSQPGLALWRELCSVAILWLLLKASGPVLPCGMSPSALKHLP